MNTRRIILWSTLIGWGSISLSIIVHLIMIPIVIREIGIEHYGVWVLVSQMVSLFALADFGIVNSVGRLVAKSRGAGSTLKVNVIITNGLFLLLTTGILIGIFVILFSTYIIDLLKIPVDIKTNGEIAFIVTGLTIALIMPLRIAQGFLLGKQNYPLINGILVLSPIVIFVGVWIQIITGKIDLVSYSFIYSFSILLPAILIFIYALPSLYRQKLSLKIISNNNIKSMISFGTSSSITSLSAALYRQGITIVLGILMGPAAAGVYGFVLNLVTMMSNLMIKISVPLNTIGSELIEKNKMKEFSKDLLAIMKIGGIIGGGSFLASILFTEAFLHILLDNIGWNNYDFYSATNAVIIMTSGLFVGIPFLFVRNVLQGIGKHWNVTIKILIGSVSSFIIGILLMLLSDHIENAAIGWASILYLYAFWLFPKETKQLLHLSYLRLFWLVWALPSLQMLCIYLFINTSLNLILIDSFDFIISMTSFVVAFIFVFGKSMTDFVSKSKQRVLT